MTRYFLLFLLIPILFLGCRKDNYNAIVIDSYVGEYECLDSVFLASGGIYTVYDLDNTDHSRLSVKGNKYGAFIFGDLQSMRPGQNVIVTWIGPNQYISYEPYTVYFNLTAKYVMNSSTIELTGGNSTSYISDQTVTLYDNHTFLLTYKEDSTYIHKIHSGKKYDAN